MAIDPGNPQRCLSCALGLRIRPSIKWTTAMDRFGHGQLAAARSGMIARALPHRAFTQCDR